MLAVSSEAMVGVFESLRFIGDALTRATLELSLGFNNGNCLCADMALESRRHGDQNDTRRRYENGGGDEEWRVASSMSVVAQSYERHKQRSRAL